MYSFYINLNYLSILFTNVYKLFINKEVGAAEATPTFSLLFLLGTLKLPKLSLKFIDDVSVHLRVFLFELMNLILKFQCCLCHGIPPKNNLAGTAGFEPADAGVKTLSLTPWRHLNIIVVGHYPRILAFLT